MCKTKFPDYIKFKNKFFPLINFTNEYKSYLTLESLTLDKYHNKFIYVVSLETSRKIPLGKNQNCEIILSDRSIESVHCFMIVNNKQVYLEDNDSKFGTLVLVQTNRLKLYQDIPLYLQIGRSFLELCVKKEFKLFDCCVGEEKNNIYSYYEQNEKYLKKDVSLTVKNEDEESESYLKNNNTQEVKLYDYNNNSINIGQNDKMSESEFLQIKRNKRNRNIKKNIYNESKDENHIENDNEQKNQNKENNCESSEEIKIESEDYSTENKKENNNNNENENENKINKSWNYNNNSENNKIENLENSNIKEDNIDENINEEIQKINQSIKDKNIEENENINDNNDNIEREELNNKETNEIVEENKENEINNLNESKKSEIKDEVSVLEI